METFTDSEKLPGEASGTQNIPNLSVVTSGTKPSLDPSGDTLGDRQQTPGSLTGTITPCTYRSEGPGHSSGANTLDRVLPALRGAASGLSAVEGTPDAVKSSARAGGEAKEEGTVQADQQSPFDGVPLQAGMQAMSLEEAVEDEEFRDAVSQPGACPPGCRDLY